MEIKDYTIRKNTKLNKDIVAMIDEMPTFGYGDNVDVLLKIAITNYFLTLVAASNLEEKADIEILFQSVSDEINLLTRELISRVAKVKHQIESIA